MQVKHIESILQYFRPSLSHHLSLRPLFYHFSVATEDKFYYTDLLYLSVMRHFSYIREWCSFFFYFFNPSSSAKFLKTTFSNFVAALILYLSCDNFFSMKMVSASYVCCTYSSAFQTRFFHGSKIKKTLWTLIRLVPLWAVWSGSILFFAIQAT